MGVLDGKAPDVEIIADCDNNINDEAAINTDSSSKHHEHKGDLVNTIAKSAGPADTEISLKDGA